MVLRRGLLLVVAAPALAASNATAPVAAVTKSPGTVGLGPRFPPAAASVNPPAVVAAARPAPALSSAFSNVSSLFSNTSSAFKGAAALVAPQAAPAFPATSAVAYKAFLQRIISFRRWRMGYFYLFSTRADAYMAAMPDQMSEDMMKLKAFLTKVSAFFDILANYEISGFIYTVLLLIWAQPPPTDMPSAIAYYQGIKVVYSFFTWQYYLLLKDYMVLFPVAYAKVDAKIKAFVDIASTYACFHAFNEWHVAKMMSVATFTDATQPITQAKLASFFWDESFIKTVHALVYYKLWSWSYPSIPWLTKAPAFVSLALPWIAFTESYWEWSIAGLEEGAAKKAAAKVQVASK